MWAHCSWVVVDVVPLVELEVHKVDFDSFPAKSDKGSDHHHAEV